MCMARMSAIFYSSVGVSANAGGQRLSASCAHSMIGSMEASTLVAHHSAYAFGNNGLLSIQLRVYQYELDLKTPVWMRGGPRFPPEIWRTAT